jgi:hypothetical protein
MMGRLIPIDPACHLGRFPLALEGLNYHSTDPTSGVSQDEIENTFQEAIQSSDDELFANNDRCPLT